MVIHLSGYTRIYKRENQETTHAENLNSHRNTQITKVSEINLYNTSAKNRK
jgi:hypothetical protein